MHSWPPDRSAAVARLEAFAPRAGGSYARARNSDFGPDRRDNISCLSPWLRYRIISEPEVLARVLAEHSPKAAEKFIQEVFWRTYWKGWLEQRPVVWRWFLDERDDQRKQVEADPALGRLLSQAEGGQTGIDGFDQWARELSETGYLHNHARMWFASIWIFTLKLPWTLGADFFLRHLLDADPASNTLSWRWVAGLQTRGKIYLASADNIEKYTDGRFRPRGLAGQAEPLDGPTPPAAAGLPEAQTRSSADLSGQLLLLTPEDLDADSLLAAAGRPAQVLLAGTDAFGADWPWGVKARAFLEDAVEDLKARLETEHQLPVRRLGSLSAESLGEAVKSHGAGRLLTPYAPLGPVADALNQLQNELAARGLGLSLLRRDWDEQAWPHATRGFFPFRKQIPDLLRRAGLPA